MAIYSRATKLARSRQRSVGRQQGEGLNLLPFTHRLKKKRLKQNYKKEVGLVLKCQNSLATISEGYCLRNASKQDDDRIMPGSIQPAQSKSGSMVNSVLNLFQVPPTDVSFSGYRMVSIQTCTTGINLIEFQIDTQEGYIDLSLSYFKIKLGLRKANIDNLAAAEKLWPVNNLAHTLFRQINVRINGVLLNDNLNHYHYKAYLETLLNYNRADGETALVPQGWFNQIDVKEEYKDNNTNLEAQDGAGHNDWQPLSQNGKDALATQKAELHHYAEGKRRHVGILWPKIFHSCGLLIGSGARQKGRRDHFNSAVISVNKSLDEELTK